MRFEIVEEFGPADVEDLVALYETYPWLAGREPADVEDAIEHTDLLVGLRDDADDLVAAARVLTDFVYYGRVYDVIVHEDRRGEGIGEWLVESITAHPSLDGLDVLTLRCREGLVDFYERCGFVRHEPTVEVSGAEEEMVTLRYEPEAGA